MSALPWIIGGAVVAGAGYWYWRKRQQEAEDNANPECVLACTAAARAYGATGNVDEICKGACKASMPVLEQGAKIIGSAFVGLRGLLGGYGDRPTIDATACPEGSSVQILNRHLDDHRGGDGSGNQGTVCIDKASGQIIGTLTSENGFTPWSPTEAAPAPTAAPYVDAAGEKQETQTTSVWGSFLAGLTGGTSVRQPGVEQREHQYTGERTGGTLVLDGSQVPTTTTLGFGSLTGFNFSSVPGL